MKRLNNLYQQIYHMDNLILADTLAQKGKSKQPGVIKHNLNKEVNLVALQQELINKTYKTSPYTNFTIYEPKERVISRLPYRDRILHHGIMNKLEPMFVANFTADTYSCIKGKGIHGAVNNLKEALKDEANTTYCLQLDIVKFYPSVDHAILKQLLRRKIKDNDLLWLLDGIIDSAPGLPIGNYLSQYFANFYLSGFDHWLKENKRVKYYYRYADDIIILARTKEELHQLFAEIVEYLSSKLKLKVKGNHRVFPVDKCGIDFVGYVFFRNHTRLRKSIKQSFARAVARNKPRSSIASYKGWAKHCNSKHLITKLLPNEKLPRIWNNNYT
jgi:RNA-directed DNA polymerase